MPSKQFKDAMAKLTKEDADFISSHLVAWTAEAPPSFWPQIAVNIENETALTPEGFTKLFNDFLSAIRSSSDPAAEWITTCRFQLRQCPGRRVSRRITGPRIRQISAVKKTPATQSGARQCRRDDP